MRPLVMTNKVISSVLTESLDARYSTQKLFLITTVQLTMSFMTTEHPISNMTWTRHRPSSCCSLCNEPMRASDLSSSLDRACQFQDGKLFLSTPIRRSGILWKMTTRPRFLPSQSNERQHLIRLHPSSPSMHMMLLRCKVFHLMTNWRIFSLQWSPSIPTVRIS